MNKETIEQLYDIIHTNKNIQVSFHYIPITVLDNTEAMENLYYGSDSYEIHLVKNEVIKKYERLLETNSKEEYVEFVLGLNKTNISEEINNYFGDRFEEVKYLTTKKLKNLKEKILKIKEC